MCPPVRAPGQTASTMIEAHTDLPSGSAPEARPARTRPPLQPHTAIGSARRAQPGRPRTEPPTLSGQLPTNTPDRAANATPRPVPARSILLIFRHLHHTEPVAVGRFYGKRPVGFTVESRRHDSGRPARGGPKHPIRAGETRHGPPRNAPFGACPARQNHDRTERSTLRSQAPGRARGPGRSAGAHTNQGREETRDELGHEKARARVCPGLLHRRLAEMGS